MTIHVYKLNCTDCDFETTVKGDAETVLDTADSHQNENRNGYFDHFVNLSLTDQRAAPRVATQTD